MGLGCRLARGLRAVMGLRVWGLLSGIFSTAILF